jgi:hypothetical protein
VKADLIDRHFLFQVPTGLKQRENSRYEFCACRASLQLAGTHLERGCVEVAMLSLGITVSHQPAPGDKSTNR